MTLIDLTSLKQNLTIQNIQHDLSDEDLALLLNNTLLELSGRIGAPIQAQSFKEMLRYFQGDMFELNHYPVIDISSVRVGSENLSNDDYVLDERLGIIYFHNPQRGFLVVEYSSCLDDVVINTKINPLVFDMIKYSLTNNFSDKGNVSSIKEMDTQINYDTSSSLGSLIESRINQLKGNYSVRIKVL